MRYFENLWAKTSRDVRDILQTKFFVLSKMVLSKVQSLERHEGTGWEEVKLFS